MHGTYYIKVITDDIYTTVVTECSGNEVTTMTQPVYHLNDLLTIRHEPTGKILYTAYAQLLTKQLPVYAVLQISATFLSEWLCSLLLKVQGYRLALACCWL
jgi:hypothetical protein